MTGADGGVAREGDGHGAGLRVYHFVCAAERMDSDTDTGQWSRELLARATPTVENFGL